VGREGMSQEKNKLRGDSKLDSTKTSSTIPEELIKGGKKKKSGKKEDINEKPKRIIKLEDNKTIGEFLTALRKQKGSSIEEANRTLKINRTYLRALEEDQLDVLPGGVYNESYIREYTKYLGGDYKKALDIYFVQTKKADLAQDEVPEVNVAKEVKVEVDRDNKKYLKKRPNAITLVASLAIVALLFYFTTQFNSNIFKSQKKADGIINVKESNIDAYVTFSILARDFASIKLLDDQGKKVADYKLKPGEVQTVDFDADKNYVIYSRDAQKLEFFVNGEIFTLFQKLEDKFGGKLISADKVNNLVISGE